MLFTPSIEHDAEPRASAPAFARDGWIATVVVLLVWLAIVLFTASRHELWRDEVRVLSQVRQAASLTDLYRVAQYDGHPALWFVVIYLARLVADTRLVLPIAALVMGFAAVAVFMRYAPFPLWLRSLFIFCALPLYEYSVMARNYGVSMLLLFVAAALYPTRNAHPYRLAIVLALLANAHVHAAILAGLIAAAWAWDLVADQITGRTPAGWARYLPLAVVAAGSLFCFVFTVPRENTNLTDVREVNGIGEVLTAVRGAVLRPDETFAALIPTWVRPKIAVLLLYAAIGGLLMRPNLLLAAFGAQVAFGVFYRLVYPGWYRHQGLHLLFLVALYWILIRTAPPAAWTGLRRAAFRGGLFGAVLLLLAFDLWRMPVAVLADIRGTRSASPQLAAFLAGSPQYHNAIIVPEPDFMLESLPYYSDATIYLPREGRYGNTVAWTTDSRAQMTLGELLRIGRAVQADSGRPVLLVLAPLDLDRGSGERKYLYGKVFTWTRAELDELRNTTTQVALLEASETDEDYQVFALNGTTP
jgi:hypothetical protein